MLAPPTATSYSGAQIPEYAFEEIEVLEDAYEHSKGDLWRDRIDGEALFRIFYRDKLTETVKDEFLKVEVSNLDIFCSRQDFDASWLREFLADAVLFFKLHKTWRVYICPICEPLHWFPHNDSLVLHLMYEHSHALPFFRVNPADVDWCCQSQALHSTVWKPIDVSAVLNTLSTTNTRLDPDHLCSLAWPLSEDCTRCELLAQLQKLFEVLLDSRERDSFALISGGCLRALVAVASEHVLRHLDPMNILPPHFRSLLCCFPLSFRFMEEDSLVRFVSLLEGICRSTQASQNSELEGGKYDGVSCNRSECPDAVSFSADPDYFFLDAAKLNFCGEHDMGSWLFKAPYFPTIKKLPAKAAKASEILQLAEKKAVLFSECLKTVHAQCDFKLLTSCLKILNMQHWAMPFLDMPSPELASNSESSSAVVEDMMSPSCYSSRVPSKRQRTEFYSGPYLELIKLAWELQFFELQVCRLCDVDLRDYVLPLLKSFLRMKSYLCIGIGAMFVPEEVKEEDASEGNKMLECLQEEHPEQHVCSIVKGEPGVGGSSIMMMPDMISTATPELCSSGIIAINVSGDSGLYPTMIDDGEVLEREPPGASAGCIYSSASQVASPHAALSRIRTDMAAAIAESEAIPEAMPESDAEGKSKAEAKSQLSQDAQGPLCSLFDMLPDSDSTYQSKVRSINAGMKEWPEKKFFEMKEFFTVAWLMREEFAWENKDNGLFVCMTVNDVVKHCLRGGDLKTAHTIWWWRTIGTRKQWRCFECNERFPDQKSHMLHHRLSWDNDLLGPTIQVQQEGQSGVHEGVNERTHRLDDSITVDRSFRRFIVDIGKFRCSNQDEEGGQELGQIYSDKQDDEGGQELGQIYSDKLKKICFLDATWRVSKLCSSSEVDEDDAEIVQIFAKLNTSKQDLSNFCASDYKVEILPSIHSFMQKHMDSRVRSWALQRLTRLLGDVRCPRLGLPSSFSIDLESPGKVIVNIEENDAGITFAYLGIRWKFSGDVSFKEPKKIEGTFMYSGISNVDDCFQYSCEVILDEEIKTMKMFDFRGILETNLEMDLSDKLLQFQAEFRKKFQKI